MEELSNDEVKDLASDWVQRIQNSLLTPGDDVRSPGVVRTRFGSRNERMCTNHEFREENGKIDYSNTQSKSPFLADSGNYVSFDDFSVDTEASRNSKEPVRSFESESKQSNVAIIDRPSKSNDQTTPRPDADFLRQKRLAFFNRSVGLQEKEDQRLFHDRNHNTPTHICASQLPRWNHGAELSSSVEHFKNSPSSYAKQEASEKMYHLESVKTPISCSLNGGPSNIFNTVDLQYQYRSPRAFETDEEELRLELWGLKEAVHSGEVNLNAYLKEPLWKHGRFLSATSHQFENVFDEHSDSGDMLSADPLHSELTLTKRTESGGYGQSCLTTANDTAGEVREENQSQCHLNENTTNCLPTVHVDEVLNSMGFNGPEPQINGPLYSGFENSDSETSLLSFGSKCDDVHYRKVVKKQIPPISGEKTSPQGKGHSKNIKHGHKTKQKRGKDKILLELTKFIEGPKDSKLSDDLYPRCLSGVPTVVNGDSLLTKGTEDHREKEFTKRGDPINANASSSCNTSVSADSILLAHSHKPTLSESHGNLMGKICPTCDEVNSKAANWCIECGTALVCIKASCLTAEQQKVFEKQCKETQALIKETLKTPMNFSHLLDVNKAEKEESLLSKDISNLSLKVSQSTSNLEEEKYSSSPHGYKRRWLRSSIAWSTYHPSELTKSPSFVKDQGKAKERQRATSFSDLTTHSTKEKVSKHHKRNGRNKSSRKRTVSCSSFGPNDESTDSVVFTNLKAFNHPQNTSLKGSRKEKQVQTSVVQRGSSSIQNQIQTTMPSKGSYSGNIYNGVINPESFSCQSSLKSSSLSSFNEGSRPASSQVTKGVVPPLNLQDVDSYDRILTLIRSQRKSEPVPYLYLPDEILLQIFSSLPHQDLVSCSRVCSQFYRITMDDTLWKVIVLRKNNNITDEWLCAIGKRRPVSLTISQCHSDKVTAKGLRDLFRNCSDSLEELNFSRCRGGELIGESVLLHVAARCRWLRSVDVSWSNVSDNGVKALVDNVKRLECLCLNGCQAVSDESIKCVANKHGKTLRIFEVFGCFHIRPAGIKILGHTCKQLRTLNIGQCHKITDSAIGSLVSNLPELENLDLRGCNQVCDSAVKKIVRNCPLVTTLVLANCPLITDVSLAEIATNLPRIRSLDICGCSWVTDNGICTLSKSCQRLELLDLTSTGVGHKSVLSLANYCSQTLCSLKLSFCTDVSYNTVVHLAKHCKRLTTLHLYGCKRIRNTSDLKLLNPALTIEC